MREEIVDHVLLRRPRPVRSLLSLFLSSRRSTLSSRKASWQWIFSDFFSSRRRLLMFGFETQTERLGRKH